MCGCQWFQAGTHQCTCAWKNIRILCDVVVNGLECDILVSEFKIQSCYFANFRTKTQKKDIEPFYPPPWVKKYQCCYSTRMALALNNSRKLICHQVKIKLFFSRLYEYDLHEPPLYPIIKLAKRDGICKWCGKSYMRTTKLKYPLKEMKTGWREIFKVQCSKAPLK